MKLSNYYIPTLKEAPKDADTYDSCGAYPQTGQRAL